MTRTNKDKRLEWVFSEEMIKDIISKSGWKLIQHTVCNNDVVIITAEHEDEESYICSVGFDTLYGLEFTFHSIRKSFNEVDEIFEKRLISYGGIKGM